ncbi:cryptochrome DASH chloroplastic/mitochondrial [Tripterygium wilfordii]|uniref:Cryptochrome DASH n=1 Tax=Tripterygium wilfordii TaxID=458696 RepID=A0A7J7DP01_TRIWF|nr:cryptochrome DASH chloroplastic/mitochondrial [Tripterygium wilfordii]
MLKALSFILVSILSSTSSLKRATGFVLCMAILSSSFTFFLLRKLLHPSKPTSIIASRTNQTHYNFPVSVLIMNSSSSTQLRSYSPSTSNTTYQVPGLDTDEIDRIADQTFERYASKTMNRNGTGIAIVWFRNDLRVLDNEVLYKAWASSEAVLPVYCLDPRLSGTTHYFGFPKTGALRAQFLIDCLADLKKNLIKRGLNLLIKYGKPEEIIPPLAKQFGAHTVFAQKETCSEEVNVERLVGKGLQGLELLSFPGECISHNSLKNCKLQLIWSSCTMYHVDDLPFNTSSLPDVYTQFRKSVEANCGIQSCIPIPMFLGPPVSLDDWGCVPSINQLGLLPQKVTKGMRLVGGESAALSRVHEYFWKKDLLRIYKETRNGMLGSDYSTKFSPWLASGSLSPRFIYEEVKRYERERLANNSTYWVLFELIWRDYFKFISIKYGNSIFHLGGPRKVEQRWSQDQKLFESWRDGCTGYPLIDANMKELSTTGFMSNRGRQIVCSFLVRDMGIDWRMGAEWFETCLLDYDPCSNYGNWTYGAGVGNDPREDRYFGIPKQVSALKITRLKLYLTTTTPL